MGHDWAVTDSNVPLPPDPDKYDAPRNVAAERDRTAGRAAERAGATRAALATGARVERLVLPSNDFDEKTAGPPLPAPAPKPAEGQEP